MGGAGSEEPPSSEGGDQWLQTTRMCRPLPQGGRGSCVNAFEGLTIAVYVGQSVLRKKRGRVRVGHRTDSGRRKAHRKHQKGLQAKAVMSNETGGGGGLYGDRGPR